MAWAEKWLEEDEGRGGTREEDDLGRQTASGGPEAENAPGGGRGKGQGRGRGGGSRRWAGREDGAAQGVDNGDNSGGLARPDPAPAQVPGPSALFRTGCRSR